MEKISPGLDFSHKIGDGAISLHLGSVPLRMSGLGTRRLLTLAIQRESVKGGGIILIDEIESGLEPYRIRRVLKYLEETLVENGLGHVIATTHSPTSLFELSCDRLCVMSKGKDAHKLSTPSLDLQKFIRTMPEAIFSKRVVICEGKTEIGFLRGASRKIDPEGPLENQGVCFADGNGFEAVTRALKMQSLGYKCALFRDSDISLNTSEKTALENAGIKIYEWGDSFATENQIFDDCPDDNVEELIGIARKGKRGSKVDSDISSAGPNSDYASLAKSKSWYKDVEPGSALGEFVVERFAASSKTIQKIKQLKDWAYES